MNILYPFNICNWLQELGIQSLIYNDEQISTDSCNSQNIKFPIPYVTGLYIRGNPFSDPKNIEYAIYGETFDVKKVNLYLQDINNINKILKYISSITWDTELTTRGSKDKYRGYNIKLYLITNYSVAVIKWRKGYKGDHIIAFTSSISFRKNILSLNMNDKNDIPLKIAISRGLSSKMIGILQSMKSHGINVESDISLHITNRTKYI